MSTPSDDDACRSSRPPSSRSPAPGRGCGATARCASAASCCSCWCWSRCRRPGSARSTRRCSTRPAATCCPGRRGEITTLDGETLKHRFLMGSRQLRPRHLQPRHLRHAGVADRRHRHRRGGARLRHRCSACWPATCAGSTASLMRVMDGVMAIPAILIAIALVAMWRGSLLTVIVAIAIPEIPRVTRLVRSLVLTIREEPYVEAAISLGTPTAKIMLRHILPNTLAPLIVQGTFICASGILVEAILSLPRRRPAARHPDLGQHHGRGPRAVQPVPAQHLLPRHLPRGDGAGGQHPRRRPARHARPEDGKRV